MGLPKETNDAEGTVNLDNEKIDDAGIKQVKPMGGTLTPPPSLISKEPVEYLNFRSEKFKSTPQDADEVTDVKSFEKYLRDTNAMMEDVEADNIELEKSVKKQEIIVERITKLNDSNKATASKLGEKQIARDLIETVMFVQIKTDLDDKLNVLSEKRKGLVKKVPTDIEGKIEFVNSPKGQGLIEDLLVTLGQNNQDLIALAESMITERNVINEDPKSGFADVVTVLQEKHDWVINGVEKQKDEFEDNTDDAGKTK